MFDFKIILVILLAIFFWAAGRNVIYGRYKLNLQPDKLPDKNFKRKFLLIRMSIITILLIVTGVVLILTTGGIDQGNNTLYLYAILVLICMIWVIGALVIKRS